VDGGGREGSSEECGSLHDDRRFGRSHC
jgi:hypothetical protein